MTRPSKVDPETVEKLAAIGCSQEEIATVVGCSRQWINQRFKRQVAAGYDRLRMSLRRWQYEKAKDGNVAMLIWLGKQYLGQTDRSESKITEQVVEIERIPAPPRLADSA
jgi:transcriptional regulator with XRE-family HTH domain